MRRLLAGFIAFAAMWWAAAYAEASEPDRIPVVASFSILADFVRNVGGDRVALATLVGPGGDAHVYTPTPEDAKTVAAAKLVVVNGLGFEGWLPRLAGSAGRRAEIVEASNGIAPRASDADSGPHRIDPHAWLAVANAKRYVSNIRDALISVDPAGATAYQANAAVYVEELDQLDHQIREAVATIPPDRRKIVSTHDAFGYFAAAYGLTVIAPQGLSTDTEPAARDLAQIIRQIRSEKITAVFLEKLGDPRLMSRIAAETGARIGGVLYDDSLSPRGGDAPTYIDMMKHNIRELTQALAN